MSKKEDLISRIIEIEWEMFSSVSSRGGAASCQENPVDFKIIRIGNFLTWSRETLECYLDDLEEADGQGRNLMTEKYARMEDRLPAPRDEVLDLIDRIVELECAWAEKFKVDRSGPDLARPVYSHQDTPEVISSETYSRGELATYSEETLESYYRDVLEMESNNLNRIEMVASNIGRMSVDGSWVDTYGRKPAPGGFRRAINALLRRKPKNHV